MARTKASALAEIGKAPKKGEKKDDGDVKGAKGAKGKDSKEDDLSEDDRRLKDELARMVGQLGAVTGEALGTVIETLSSTICEATSSLTSVPKPLKYLKPHYPAVEDVYRGMAKGAAHKEALADALSVMAMTMGKSGGLESLSYKLEGNPGDLQRWGHQYVRHLTGEIVQAFRVLTGRVGERETAVEVEKGEGAGEGGDKGQGKEVDMEGAGEAEAVPTFSGSMEGLMGVVDEVVPFCMAQNLETDAVDLLIEVERLPAITAHSDADNYVRTSLYIATCANYVPEPDDTHFRNIALDMNLKHDNVCGALALALRLNDPACVARCVKAAASDLVTLRQVCYILAGHSTLVDIAEVLGDDAGIDEDEVEQLQEIANNARLSDHFLALVRDLEVTEAKTPEDIYKTHLVEGRGSSGMALDSARENLAATFVNAFVNAGFGQDKLMYSLTEDASERDAWVYKNKEHGKMSAAASLGMIFLWDADRGTSAVDKFRHHSDSMIVSGGLLGIGISCAGVHSEFDQALAILKDVLAEVGKDAHDEHVGGILGLGLAYAGSQKEPVAETVLPFLEGGTSVHLETAAVAALSLGLVFVGSGRDDMTKAIVAMLVGRKPPAPTPPAAQADGDAPAATPEVQVADPMERLACAGLALLFLNRGELSAGAAAELQKLPDGLRDFALVTLEAAAYAGTGNVLKAQQFLRRCLEPLEAAQEGSLLQASAVLGFALVGMSEDVGTSMSLRSLKTLLQYGDASVRKAVPLAMGAMHVSSPDVNVVDALGRLTHDANSDVAASAVFALGLVGAGTNNARVAQMLRQLTLFYSKDTGLLFVIRIAQGLLHMGKGLMTLSPIHSDSRLLKPASLAGLVAILYTMLDHRSLILGRHHYLLYVLVAAMRPRMLITLDEDLGPLPTPVRVGTSVDIAGQAGRPRSITGFQTHTTPVLLASKERAELGTTEYTSVADVLEGVCILRKKPEDTPKQGAKQ